MSAKKKPSLHIRALKRVGQTPDTCEGIDSTRSFSGKSLVFSSQHTFLNNTSATSFLRNLANQI